MAASDGKRIEWEQLYDLFMQAPTILAVLRGPRHIFEVANPGYMELVGKHRDIIGLTIRQALPELAGQGFYELLDQVYKTGKQYVGTERPVLLKRRGTGSGSKLEKVYVNFIYKPVRDREGNVNGIMVHAVDVTEQVISRKKTEGSERQLRFMAESMPQMVFTITPEGSMRYINPQWERYTGVPLMTLLKSVEARYDLYHPEDVARARADWEKAFKAGTPLEHEYRLRRHDAEYRWHICRINPMKDANGNIVMWVGSNTDIDDIKRAAQRRHELEIKTAALTEQRTQLLALNQAKDEFISLASHQLRTPATGVKQYLGMLLQGYAGKVTREQEMFLQTAYESNERQIMIVNDLLQVARIDAGKVTLHKEPTDVVRLVKNVLNEQASKFGERQQAIVLTADPTRLMAQIDADRIRMVIDNIIDNASKYTQPGKTIWITIRNGAGQTVLLTIKDEGVGVAPEDIERMFHKFSRLENPLSRVDGAPEGSGLGLYWAKKIVDLHEGSIRVRSVVGKGTTFTIKLPLK